MIGYEIVPSLNSSNYTKYLFGSGIPIVKLEDKELAKSIGVYAHPSLVIFRQYGKEPIIYAGDIKNKDAMLEWLLVQKDPTNEAIEEQVKR